MQRDGELARQISELEEAWLAAHTALEEAEADG
jgi:hypothetical protein